MPDPAFERDLAYIQEKTGGQRLACRDDIVPQEMIEILPEIAFVSPVLDAAGNIIDVSVKLEGTKLVSFYGEQTGKTVAERLGPDVSMRVVAAVSYCMETRKPVVAELLLSAPLQREIIVRSFYIPLSEDGENIDSYFAHFRISHDKSAPTV